MDSQREDVVEKKEYEEEVIRIPVVVDYRRARGVDARSVCLFGGSRY